MSKITSNLNANNSFIMNNNINNNTNNENSILRENASAEESIVNIPNYEGFAICQRCKQKESVFSCIVCESFKFLCTKCDNYIHSLPSKQAHQRVAIISNQRKTEYRNKEEYKNLNKIEENNNNNNMSNKNLHINPNNSFDLNYKFNLSPINRPNPLGQEKDMPVAEYNIFSNQKKKSGDDRNHGVNNSGENNNNNHSINHESIDNTKTNPKGIKNEFMNIQEGGYNNSYYGGVSNFKIPNAQNFSREYVYEIKTIFDKEKSELLYKINSLQMTLERLKVNFNEQINYLHNQLEDINKRSSYSIKQIQEDSDNRIKQISEERDSQYEEYKAKLEELESINLDLAKKLEENLKNICEIKSSTNYKQSELEMEIRKKEEELEKQKIYNENKIVEIRKYLEDDKIKLMESYDKNINLLIAEFDQTKEKLNKLLKDRENDLRNSIEKHKLEVENLNNINKELICEIDCHKMNIVNLRKRAEDEKDELEFLREENDSMKRELRFHISELKMLDGQNKTLLKENEDLRIQISKLDKLVYGKIRIAQLK